MPAPRITGRIVILVDDGLATGGTMIAAARSIRAHSPAQLIVAIPVASQQAIKALKKEADVVQCLTTLELFWAVGAHYEDFARTEDAEVASILRDARATHASVTGLPLG